MIGARVAVPSDRRVVLLTGDGAWGYCLAEFETAARLNMDITVVVLNNKSLGWIAHIQARKEQPLSNYSDIDFAQVAQAMGGSGTRATTTDEFQEALGKALVGAGPRSSTCRARQPPRPYSRWAPWRRSATRTHEQSGL